MKDIDLLKTHAKVEDVYIGDDGDTLVVTLKKPWARYNTGRRDGFTKAFECEDENPDTGKPYTHAQNARRALNWVRHDTYEDKKPQL